MKLTLRRRRPGRVRAAARRPAGVLVATALGLATLGVAATPADAAETWIRISAYHSKLVANVAGSSTANGAPVIQWPYSDSQWNGQWKMTRVGDTGYYTVENRYSHQCLDVENHVVLVGARVVQMPCDGSLSQQWEEVPHKTLPVQHMRTAANPYMFLTVENGSYDRGARFVMTWKDDNLANQMMQRW